MRVCGSRHVGRAVVLAGLVAVAGQAAGCGSGQPIGEVEGKVTFKGQAVAEGTVVFQGAEGHGGEAPLDPDGTYVLRPPENRLPVGEYVVIITPLLYLDSSDPRTPPSLVEKRAPNIPEKYRRSGSTPLRVSVKQGRNELDFDLKP